MTTVPPLDPAAGAHPAPDGRAARTAPASSGGPGTPAGPAYPPGVGSATHTSRPVTAPKPTGPGGTPTPLQLRGSASRAGEGREPPPDGRPCGEPAPDRGRP